MVPPLDDTCEYPSGVVTPVVVPLPEDTPVWLFVSVQDTGPGLAPAERANLFQRFSREAKLFLAWNWLTGRGKQYDSFSIWRFGTGSFHLSK